MATVKEIYAGLDSWAPFSTQAGFDNAGLLVGHSGREISAVLVALDITPDVVCEAASLGADLIVAHHPVIFEPVRALSDENLTGKLLLSMAEQKIAAICAHTNLDGAQGGVNDQLACALELRDITFLEQEGVDEQGRAYGIGRIGTAHKTGMNAAEYAAFVKEKLGANSVRFVDAGKEVCRVAVGGGSCGSMLAEVAAAGCDTFVTADLKYNMYLDAREMGINLMDAGHFATENVVCAPVAEFLQKAFPELSVSVSKVHREVYGEA